MISPQAQRLDLALDFRARLPHSRTPTLSMCARRVVVDGRVLDVSTFGDAHPGGARALQNLAGTDATEVFLEIHAPVADFIPMVKEFIVGRLAESGSTGTPRHHPRPTNNLVPWEEFRATQLDSPFPASRFHSS